MYFRSVNDKCWLTKVFKGSGLNQKDIENTMEAVSSMSNIKLSEEMKGLFHGFGSQKILKRNRDILKRMASEKPLSQIEICYFDPCKDCRRENPEAEGNHGKHENVNTNHNIGVGIFIVVLFFIYIVKIFLLFKYHDRVRGRFCCLNGGEGDVQ